MIQCDSKNGRSNFNTDRAAIQKPKTNKREFDDIKQQCSLGIILHMFEIPYQNSTISWIIGPVFSKLIVSLNVHIRRPYVNIAWQWLPPCFERSPNVPWCCACVQKAIYWKFMIMITISIWCMMRSSNWNLFRVTCPLWVTGEFPAQRPVTRSFDVSFDLRFE